MLAKLRTGLPAAIRARVWDESGGVCHYCGEAIHPFRVFTVDHIVAVAKGGTDAPENLVAACRTCNSRKHTKSVEVFLNPLVPDPPRLPELHGEAPWSLAAIRRSRGMTQAELAARLGVHPNTVVRWEMDGENAARPALPTLRYLASILGVNPDEIDFGAMGAEKKPGRPRKPSP